MGIELPIVVYTHTDMIDVWDPFFDRIKKYMPKNKIYICVNKQHEKLSEYSLVLYDDSKMYTERLLDCINKIDCDVFLFTHEDMILYDIPDYEILEKYCSYVRDKKANSIKLIYVGDGGLRSDFDSTLITNEFSKFSIQPTIIHKEVLLNILEKSGSLNIWNFETSITGTTLDFMAYKGDESKRGMYHYNSFVYPYIATAINKGKWNLSEYAKELDPIFEQYNINPFKRGII